MVEVIIIIAILSLLGVIAVPNFIAAKEAAMLGISIEEYHEIHQKEAFKRAQDRAQKKIYLKAPKSEFDVFYRRHR